VGDFYIATEKRDVHDALSWETMYDPSELQALQALMGPDGSNCKDTWRLLHPQTDGVYTVWDEKTSARAFNVVGVLPNVLCVQTVCGGGRGVLSP
jgi:exonuclease III